MAPNLCTFSINPDDAKEEWLRFQLRSGALAGLLDSSRIFQYLTAAAPGLAELVTLGKVWELAQLERRDGRSAAALRPGDRRRARHRPRPRAAARARAPTRDDRPRRADPQPRQPDRRLHARPGADRRRGGGAGRGDAGERDDRPRGPARRTSWASSWPPSLVNGVLPERFSGAEAEAMAVGRRRRAPRPRARRWTAALAAHERARAQRSQVAPPQARRRRPGRRPCPSCSPRRSAPRTSRRCRASWSASCEQRARPDRAQGGGDLRRLGRRGQDHHLGGHRRGHGRSAARRPRCSPSTRPGGWPTRWGCPSWATRSARVELRRAAASCGR